MNAQRTLRRPVSCTGIGLHSGNKVTLSLKPAPADYGIRFQRADLGGLEIPATVTHLGGIQYQTGPDARGGLGRDRRAPARGADRLGIDNVIVELNHPEVPIMDGSAAPFVYLILNEAGVKRLTAPRRYLKVLRPISLTHGDKRIALYPSDHFKVTYSISFDHPLLRHQSRTMRITEETFVEDIAPARTFGFLKEVEMLRQRGLALGGSLDNAIVLGETGVLNNALRFEDEFVRHKILDVIGDLSLVGHPVDRAPRRAPRRPRAAHGVRGEDSRRDATPGGWSKRRPSRHRRRGCRPRAVQRRRAPRELSGVSARLGRRRPRRSACDARHNLLQSDLSVEREPRLRSPPASSSSSAIRTPRTSRSPR